MWPMRGIRRPREDGDTQNNTDGYTVRTPHPRGKAITDWAKAWAVMEDDQAKQQVEYGYVTAINGKFGGTEDTNEKTDEATYGSNIV